jgi:hypothetical protein
LRSVGGIEFSLLLEISFIEQEYKYRESPMETRWGGGSPDLSSNESPFVDRQSKYIKLLTRSK